MRRKRKLLGYQTIRQRNKKFNICNSSSLKSLSWKSANSIPLTNYNNNLEYSKFDKFNQFSVQKLFSTDWLVTSSQWLLKFFQIDCLTHWFKFNEYGNSMRSKNQKIKNHTCRCIAIILKYFLQVQQISLIEIQSGNQLEWILKLVQR